MRDSASREWDRVAHMKTVKWLLASMAMFAFAALAADVNGTWKGKTETPNGTVERTFVFKVDGNKLTGESSSNMSGKSEIKDGKIDGDNLSFTIDISIQGYDLELHYKGKVAGDEIKFSVEVPGSGQTVEYTAKKVS
jgi:opacity protein-like surface antigen